MILAHGSKDRTVGTVTPQHLARYAFRSPSGNGNMAYLWQLAVVVVFPAVALGGLLLMARYENGVKIDYANSSTGGHAHTKLRSP